MFTIDNMNKIQIIKTHMFLKKIIESELLSLDLTEEAEEIKKILEFAYLRRKSGLSIEETSFVIELYKKERSAKKIAILLNKPTTTVYEAIRNNMPREEFERYSERKFKKEKKHEEKDVKLNDLKSKWLNAKN